MSSSISTCVYIKDKSHGWVPGNVIRVQEDGKAIVRVTIPSQIEHPKTLEISTSESISEVEIPSSELDGLPLQNVDASGNAMVLADMVELPSLTEPAILSNLMERHVKQLPYTKIGDIIIAMNPFMWVEGMYTSEKRLEYANKLIWNFNESMAGEKIEPHVYETSASAYRGLACEGRDQSILVSGESGAGKTETVKIVMSHLASIYGGEDGDDDSSSSIVKRVLDSNPLLEAFGNAKTVRNDNSSRFGKYIQLQFDVEDATTAAYANKSVPSCILAGSRCETYLLEKSRITGHEDNERTYHIFYQLLDAPADYKRELWAPLAEKSAADFKYVGTSTTTRIEGRTDSENWSRTAAALATLGIVDDQLSSLMVAVTIVIQLGNLTFVADPSNDENSIIGSKDELAALSDLMGFENPDMLQKSLITRTVVAGKDVYKVPLNPTDAKDNCDAFAKEIYQQIFDWLVRRINEATCAELNYADAADMAEGDEFGIVGLLDIFGFESFKVNRFEQLCINYTNEKLQQKYTHDVFQSVQEEYEFEGIELPNLHYEDNTDVVALIEGRMGLIAVLNEECVRPRGNDQAFVSKIKTLHKEMNCLIADRLHRPNEFGIRHYAGDVKYDANMFVQKNMDSVPNDLIECARACSNELISTELEAAAKTKAAAAAGGGGGRSSKKTAYTISTKFRQQLKSLMSSIEDTRTRYIRCIKPNKAKQAGVVNFVSSLEQLRCAGVVAAVRISRAAFPNRLSHDVACDRFACLMPEDEVEKMELSERVKYLMNNLLSHMAKDGKDAFVCGKTRVYFLAGALEYLEAERLVALGKRAVVLQRVLRGFLTCKDYRTTKLASIRTQAFVRSSLARRSYNRLRHSAVMVACWARVLQARALLLSLKQHASSTVIQCFWRRVHAMETLNRCVSSAILLQRIARGSIQRPIFREMLAQAKEDAKIENQLKILQRKLAEAEKLRKEEQARRIEAEKRATAGGGAVVVTDDEALRTVSEQGEEKKTEGDDALIHESREMIDFLKKEVFTLRSKNYLLRTDLTEVKSKLEQVNQLHESSLASIQAMHMQISSLTSENHHLATAVADQRKQLKEIKNKYNVQSLLIKAERKSHATKVRIATEAHRVEVEELKEEQKQLNLQLALQSTSNALKATPSKSHRQRRKKATESPSSASKPSSLQSSLHSNRNRRRRSNTPEMKKSIKRVDSSNRLRIRPSNSVPDGTWDRGGYDALMEEENLRQQLIKNGSIRKKGKGGRNSKSSSRSNSRPQTPVVTSSLAASLASQKSGDGLR